MTPAAKWAILAVRTCGLFVASLAVWQMLGNLVGTYRDIDPSYLGYFVSSQLARPFCGIVVGAVLYAFSRPLGRLIARGLDK
jgi:hypothetical protein